VSSPENPRCPLTRWSYSPPWTMASTSGSKGMSPLLRVSGAAKSTATAIGKILGMNVTIRGSLPCYLPTCVCSCFCDIMVVLSASRGYWTILLCQGYVPLV
jgi:hypothetical protein